MDTSVISSLGVLWTVTCMSLYGHRGPGSSGHTQGAKFKEALALRFRKVLTLHFWGPESESSLNSTACSLCLPYPSLELVERCFYCRTGYNYKLGFQEHRQSLSFSKYDLWPLLQPNYLLSSWNTQTSASSALHDFRTSGAVVWGSACLIQQKWFFSNRSCKTTAVEHGELLRLSELSTSRSIAVCLFNFKIIVDSREVVKIAQKNPAWPVFIFFQQLYLFFTRVQSRNLEFDISTVCAWSGVYSPIIVSQE